MRSSISAALLLRKSGGTRSIATGRTAATTTTTRLIPYRTTYNNNNNNYCYLSSQNGLSSSIINNGRDFRRQLFSTTAAEEEEEELVHAAAAAEEKADSDDNNDISNNNNRPRKKIYPCGSPGHEDDYGRLPPPLPEPKYSVHKRILPSQLTPMSSIEGRKRLLESLNQNMGESYWPLIEQFVSQSDPAYCGVTTLMMTLNAFCIDPQIRWRGGWRFYGDEQVLLDRCCLSNDRIKRVGVTLEDFRLLGRCHGLNIELKRPEEKYNSNNHNQFAGSYPTTTSSSKDDNSNINVYTIENFRDDIKNVLIKKGELKEPSDHNNTCSSFYETQQENEMEDHSHHTSLHHHHHDAIIVVSYSRSYLGQTGDGHFSPIAAYHEQSDSVLILDVARFKYAPYWVSIDSLWGSMKEMDLATNRSRGWFVMKPPKNHSCHTGTPQEDRRPAELVRLVGEEDSCPVNKIKVDFCQVNNNNNINNSHSNNHNNQR